MKTMRSHIKNRAVHLNDRPRPQDARALTIAVLEKLIAACKMSLVTNPDAPVQFEPLAPIVPP